MVLDLEKSLTNERERREWLAGKLEMAELFEDLPGPVFRGHQPLHVVVLKVPQAPDSQAGVQVLGLGDWIPNVGAMKLPLLRKLSCRGAKRAPLEEIPRSAASKQTQTLGLRGHPINPLIQQETLQNKRSLVSNVTFCCVSCWKAGPVANEQRPEFQTRTHVKPQRAELGLLSVKSPTNAD